MKKWTKPAITIVAVTVMSYTVDAQSGGGTMANPMASDKTYTGCIEAGPTHGTFTLTNAMAAMGMGKDAMNNHAMTKDAPKKGAMGKDAMPSSLAISSKTIDLSKHVGHQVSATGSDAMGMAMSKPDTMAKEQAEKSMPALSITAITMIATTCTK